MRIATLAAMAALGLALPAQASSDGTTVTVKVPYHDLDLGSSSDLSTLKRRVGTAIRKACASPSIATFATADALSRCRADAEADAALQIERHRRSHLVALAQRGG